MSAPGSTDDTSGPDSVHTEGEGRNMNATHREAGVTLIELMVVVIILGILAAIAYPSYIDHVRKTRRADCEGALIALGEAMERHFTENGNYCGAGSAAAAASSDCTGSNNSGTPTVYASTCPLDGPATGATTYYNLSIENNVTKTTYTVDATPAGDQTNDPCGTLTLDQTGQRGVSGATTGYTASMCWQQ
jgi:type IV pilus assembly protein PilE